MRNTTCAPANYPDGYDVSITGLEDARVLDVRNIIWCSGFESGFDCLHG